MSVQRCYITDTVVKGDGGFFTSGAGYAIGACAAGKYFGSLVGWPLAMLRGLSRSPYRPAHVGVCARAASTVVGCSGDERAERPQLDDVAA